MVECFFRDLFTDRLRNGALCSVQQLIAAIKQNISVRNKNPKPLVRNAKTHDILAKVLRADPKLSSRQNDALLQGRSVTKSVAFPRGLRPVAHVLPPSMASPVMGRTVGRRSTCGHCRSSSLPPCLSSHRTVHGVEYHDSTRAHDTAGFVDAAELRSGSNCFLEVGFREIDLTALVQGHAEMEIKDRD